MVLNSFVDDSYKDVIHVILTELNICDIKVAEYPNYHIKIKRD